MNKKSFRQFAVLLTAVTILVVASFYILQNFFKPLTEITFFLPSVIVLYVVVLLIFLASIYTISPQLFIQIVIAGTAVKLLLFGAYNFFMIFQDLKHARANVIFFFIGYVIFTILEITSLYKYVNSASRVPPRN